MDSTKLGGILLAALVLLEGSARAAQNSNAVGYDKVTVLANSDAVVSAPFSNTGAPKTLDQMFPGSLAGLSYLASTSPTAGGRKTEVLVPDFTTVLDNKSPAA